MATGQEQNIVGSDNQLPPPYSPPQQYGQQVQHSGQQYGQPPYGQKYVQPPQPGQQYGQPHQGQQYVQQFIHQNPQGFVQTQQPHTIPPAAGYAGMPGNYGYDQSMSPMPPTMMSSSSSTTVVVNQTNPAAILVVNPAPYSYMVPAVLTCLFCCPLLGLGAIIAATMSWSQSNEMQYDEARRSANIARGLVIASLVGGIIGYILLIVLTSTR